jgi:hypothetical protein
MDAIVAEIFGSFDWKGQFGCFWDDDTIIGEPELHV